MPDGRRRECDRLGARDLDLVELVALIRLYPVNFAEGETSEVEVQVRGIRRVKVMLVTGVMKIYHT